MFSAIILSAGSGIRLGEKFNKGTMNLGNKPIYEYSIDEFRKAGINNIYLVVREKDLSKFSELKNVYIVVGGKTRQESVYNALKEVKTEYVFIHDSARPFIKHEYINKMINEASNYNCITLGIKASDTIKLVNDNSVVNIKRDNIYLIQTPQLFKTKMILSSHINSINDKYLNQSDDTCLIEQYYPNEIIKIIEGSKYNIKITTKEDLEIGELFINGKI